MILIDILYGIHYNEGYQNRENL